ncbi:hypothetical protein BH10BAC2_BH10BAC2_48650 [soil metagenome]
MYILRTLFILILFTFLFSFSSKAQSDVGGVYEGILSQKKQPFPYAMQLQLKQNGSIISGEVFFGEYRSGKLITGVASYASPSFFRTGFKIEGALNGNVISFTDVSPTVQKNLLYKKDYTATLTLTEDSLIFEGEWDAPDNMVFRLGQLKKNDGKTCGNGSFRIATLKIKCNSGDCDNGKGVQITQIDKYEGDFKDGKRTGFGKQEIFSGQFKGNKYTGEFRNWEYHGKGKLEYPPNMSGSLYYEGNFINNSREGNGMLVQMDGTRFVGTFTKNQFSGLGKKVNGPITTLAYWEFMAPADRQGLPLSVLKHHQDTMFAKFKKCDCLEKGFFNFSTIGLENVSYDVIDGYSGKKVGEEKQLEVASHTDKVNGLVNNTNHDIYIRCYREFYFDERKATEYFDDSYIVKPGEYILPNFRLPPKGGESVALWARNTFVFEGQYCAKQVANCLPSVKKAGSTILSVTKTAYYNKLIKKGNKISISASGQIKVGTFVGYSGPEGIDGYENYNQVEGFKHGALLVRIGEKGKWLAVGRSILLTAQTDGKIEFLVNDNDPDNNTGNYEVEITVK